MKDHYLFTYGLLRKSAGHEMSDFLSNQAHFLGEAKYQGKLYLIDYYPGVVSSNDPKNQVVGDLFRLDDLSILKVLDSFEGIGSQYAEPYEYQRKLQKVTCSDRWLDAWVYLYNLPLQEKNRILSGDFLN